MTREEILNTPEIVDFMLDKSVMVDSKIKLHKRLKELCKLAIKALEQEPCEYAISRDDALKLIRDCGRCDDKSAYGTIYHGIEHLPPVQPKIKTGHWIPVDERLPKPRIDVWCNSDMGQMVGYYDEYVKTWYGRDYLELMVTVWMPLPEPYKPQESEDKA